MNDEQHREKVEQFLDHTHTRGGDVGDLMQLIENYVEARHKHGAPEFNSITAHQRDLVREALSTHHAAPGAPQQLYSTPGYALAMRVMQSDLYAHLDDRERAECDALIAAGQGALQQEASGDDNLPLSITSAPERIWLDLGFDPWEEDAHFSNLSEVTWSEENATGHGIEYVRASRAAATAPTIKDSSIVATAPADPYILLIAEQAMTIDRDTLRSALAWYGVSWGEDSDEAFACRLARHVNALTTAIDVKRREATAPAGGVTHQGIGRCMLSGPKEDVAALLLHLPDVEDERPLKKESDNSTLPFETALHELIGKILPDLDSGDIVADARTASAALTTAARAAEPVTREFTNELGNAIRITIEGTSSVSENILTPMEVSELKSALNEHGGAAQGAEPVLWASPEQLIVFTTDPAGEHGHYLPLRRTTAGKFTMPLYDRPGAAQGAHTLPMTCRHSNRSDCALFGMDAAPALQRPSAEWYAKMIRETEGLDDNLPQGGAAQRAEPVKWVACETPDFGSENFTGWRQLPSDGTYVYHRNPANIMQWLRFPVPQPPTGTEKKE